MTVTIAPPVEYTEAVPRLDTGRTEPRLHAFPPGSNVALCGRTRKPGDENVVAGRRCTACVNEASRKSFVGR